MYNKNLQYSLPIILLLLLVSVSAWSIFEDTNISIPLDPVKVELISNNGQYMLYCNGKPYYVKGAGSGYDRMESLAQHGANAMRTWSVNNEQTSGKEILDRAYQLGLMVSMGIDVGRERHGFDYNNQAAVKEQFDRIQEEVLSLKDHPALLVWGIGNELNLNYQNVKVWDAVNNIARMIHELDPNHPTTTMLAAGNVKEDINTVIKYCPEIDFLSFQIYGDIANLPDYINESNWDGAYIISEWGVTGHWEVERTTWDRPIEQTSHEKAVAIKENYEKVILANKDRCIGSFVFLWGQKQERTPTWYGLFLENGDETEAVDVMHYLWNKHWPDNRSPILHSLLLDEQNSSRSIQLSRGQKCKAIARVTDPDNDTITYTWTIHKEIPHANKSEGGDLEQHTDKVLESIGEFNDEFEFTVPEPGEYRLFVYATDGKDHSGTANIPFLVLDN